MEHCIPFFLKLLRSGSDAVQVSDFELDTGLRYRPIRRPLAGAEACFGSLRERPHTKVLAAANALAEIVVIALVALEWQPQRIDEEFAALGWIRRDDGHARDEQNLHITLHSGGVVGTRIIRQCSAICV
jgi:hypothetical protein